MNTTKWMCVILVMAGIAGTAQAQTTYTWANTNVFGTPTANRDWFGANKGTWIAADPVSGNLNTIQFFQSTSTSVPNTANPSTQTVNLNNDGNAFELGTLTLSGRASATVNANLTMTLSGDALNFSAATGTVNLDSVNATRIITYNVGHSIQLGTASSGSTLTFAGNGNNTFNFSGSISELQVGGGSKLIKSGTSWATISGAVTISGGLEVNDGSLSLTSSSNAIANGITLNGGTLYYSAASTLNGNNITVNGAPKLYSNSTSSTTATITLNNGSDLTLGSNNTTQTIAGNITGAGSLSIGKFSSGSPTVYLSNTTNTFTGTFSIIAMATTFVGINSLADSASLGAGNIRFAGGNGAQTLSLESGVNAPITLNNRRIEFVSTGNGAASFGNSSSQAFTINTDLLVGYTGAASLTLGGNGTGLNSFNGKLENGSATSLALSKSGSGKWVLSNTNNTYTGVTTISGGTLQVAKLANGGSPSSMGISSSAAANLSFGGGTLRYVGTGDFTDRGFTQTGAGTFDASGTGPLILANTATPAYGTINVARALTLTGTSTDTNTLAAALANNGTGLNTFTKTGIGTWVLRGANSFTGASSLSGGGTLVLDYSVNDNSKLSTGAFTVSLANGAGGGTLSLSGGSHTQVVASTSLANGTGLWITRTSGSSSLQLNAITRANGQNAISLSEDSIASTDQTNGNGILGGWATVSNNWAVNSMNGADGAIIGLTSYTTTVPTTGGDAAANYQLTGSLTLTGNLTGNSLRLVNGANSDVLDMGSVGARILTPGSGHSAGILYVGGFDNNYTITGAGTVKSATANNTLNVNVYTGTLTVNALLNSGTAATVKYGAGTLVVGGNNVATGPFWVLDGTVRLTHNNAAGNTAGGVGVQNGAALELTNSVAIANEALTIVGTGVSNGGALRNVASNTSTYGGTVTIGDGGARINSDSEASLTLTNASAIVTAVNKDVTIGGNGDTEVSGLISGAGNLVKDGLGTLTLSGTNTYSGTTTISGGKLALGGHNVLNGKPITLSGGTLDAGTYTNTLSTLKVSGSGTIVMSPGAVLAFADSSAIQWSGTVNISGAFAAGTSLRFGTTSAGLTSDQIASLKATGYTLTLDANGYLTGRPSGTLINFM